MDKCKINPFGKFFIICLFCAIISRLVVKVLYKDKIIIYLFNNTYMSALRIFCVKIIIIRQVCSSSVISSCIYFLDEMTAKETAQYRGEQEAHS